MSTSRPSRRRLLAATAAGGALAALGGPALSGCTGAFSDTPVPDPLAPVADRAETDARFAAAVAAAHPDLAGVATTLADDRRAHARAVRAELRRADSSTPPQRARARRQPSVPAERDAARQRLATALQAAQDQAGTLLGAAPAHRAALLGSIAACCASHLAAL